MMNSLFTRYVLKTLRLFAGILLLALAIRFFAFEPGQINGRSMEDTFIDSDRFLVNKISYVVRSPKRGDIIQVLREHENGEKELIVKRIIGLPGERITIERNAVYVTKTDGTTVKLTEPYIKPTSRTLSHEGTIAPYTYSTIPENMYFVMGDNREHSTDSRQFGTISRIDILGKIREPKKGRE